LAKLVTSKLPVAIYSLTYNISQGKVFVNFVSKNFSEVTKCSAAAFKEYFEFAKTVVVDKGRFLSIFEEDTLARDKSLREYRVRVPSGGYQELFDCCHVKRISDDIITCVGTIVNRTEKKINELALRISEDRLRVALEGAGAGFFDWVDGGGEAIFCDAKALELCGITDFNVRIRDYLRIVAPGFLKVCIGTLRDIFSGKCTFFSIEFNLKRDRDRWLWASGKIISSDPVSRKPLRIAGTIRDTTVSKQIIIERERMNDLLERRIRERTDQLERELATKLAAEQQLIENLNKERELNNAKTMFVNMVSHEFRTPLAIMQGATDLLGKYHKKLANKERLECLNGINKAIQRITRTMDDILVLGKVQGNQLKFTPTEVDILTNCRSILEDVEGFHGNKRTVFEVSMDVPLKLYIDPGLLYHILSNLLSNALKYSPVEKPVILRLDYKGGELEIFIEDFGIGIPEGDRANIFKIFHRGSNVSDKQGIGIGMFVVKYCVSLHRGSIAISSKDGDGTIFRVRLPAAKTE
jgi:signal transduction histidine kinase